MDAVLSIVPQATVGTVLLGAFVAAMRWAHQDRDQQTRRVSVIQDRHDQELRARDERIHRQEEVIADLRRDLEGEREKRRSAEEREHALRIGGET